MIQTGYGPFRRGFEAYSTNIGRIVKYDFLNGYDILLKVHSEKSIFSGGYKSSFVRRYSCFPINFNRSEKKEMNPEDIEAIANALEHTKVVWSTEKRDWVPTDETGTFIIIDPRVVRAYVLGYYEFFKDTDNVDEKRISALLNSSVDWTIDDAKEWMARNKFQTSDTLTDFQYTPEEENYISDPTSLIDPYWTPKR